MSSIVSQTMLPQLPGGLFQLSVQDYHDMIEAGILTPEDKVELIDGYLVKKMPQNSPHSSTVRRLSNLLARMMPAGWLHSGQLPITLASSEPEPDAALVRGDDRSFDTHHPEPADFGIVIEVADSTLAFDRGIKLELYAEAHIPEYWIVNLVENQVEVYTQPQGTAYTTRTDYTTGQSVPLVLDGAALGSLAVADLLP